MIFKTIKTDIMKLNLEKLEQLDLDQGPGLIPTSEKRISLLAKILIIIHWTKPIFRHEQKFDKSSPYMKLGRTWVIND